MARRVQLRPDARSLYPLGQGRGSIRARSEGMRWRSLCWTGSTRPGTSGVEDLETNGVFRLSGTAVTDAGLLRLSGLTRLSFLGLRGTHVTDGGSKKLKQALPRVLGAGSSMSRSGRVPHPRSHLLPRQVTASRPPNEESCIRTESRTATPHGRYRLDVSDCARRAYGYNLLQSDLAGIESEPCVPAARLRA